MEKMQRMRAFEASSQALLLGEAVLNLHYEKFPIFLFDRGKLFSEVRLHQFLGFSFALALAVFHTFLSTTKDSGSRVVFIHQISILGINRRSVSILNSTSILSSITSRSGPS